LRLPHYRQNVRKFQTNRVSMSVTPRFSRCQWPKAREERPARRRSRCASGISHLFPADRRYLQ
jgi:hypothetical protein